MKLATWNVNWFNVRLRRLPEWLAKHESDVMCIQNMKLENEKSRVAALRDAGYELNET